MASPLVLKNFTVRLETPGGWVPLAENISLEVKRGETLCIVGESGSGKSVTMLSAIRLLEFTAPVALSGTVEIDGVDVTDLSQREMARIRGRRVGVVFQEAMEALNPTKTIAAQLVEAFVVTREETGAVGAFRTATSSALREEGHEKAVALLVEVGLDRPEKIMTSYPHQLSGGMQQRVMIALALIGDPDLLIADEPTTALDVTIQAEILELLRRLQRERNMSCVLITHDMGVASEVADRIAVLYAGQLIEVGPAQQMLSNPQHPYTKALLECVPRPGQRLAGRMRSIPGSVPAPGSVTVGDRFAARNALATKRCLTEDPPVHVSDDGTHMVRAWAPVSHWTPELVESLTGGAMKAATPPRTAPPAHADAVISLRNLNKTYAHNARRAPKRGANSKLRTNVPVGVQAVKNLDLDIFRGEFFGIVGETGSGKSTLGRLIMDLEYADHGSSLTVAGHELSTRRTFAAEREMRRSAQMVFQNPQDSIDPRRTIGQAIAEPLQSLTKLSRKQIDARVAEMLDAVGLPASAAGKYASEISGGQRQRVAIARAIAPRPQVIVADEPTSALDVSVQGQIVNLMLDLQREFGLTYVFITHNLSLITAIADRVGVMYKGELVEVAAAVELTRNPQHAYTQRLLASNPDPFAASVS
jgi:peptide/nickel transport system ATP-binding protein